MKNVTKILSVSMLAFMFTIGTYGQSSDIATASAEIYTPIAITKTVDMNFGIIAGSSTAGTVVLGTDNNRTGAGGVTLLGGTVTAAQFEVTGLDRAFDFSTPGTITLSDGTNTMDVTAITNDAPAAISGGLVTVSVGGTLNVNANQVAGTYQNTTDLEATVNYN